MVTAGAGAGYRRTTAIGSAAEEPIFAEALRAVAVGPQDQWILAGDRQIVELDGQGGSQLRWSTSEPAWSVAVDPEGRVWVGGAGQIEIFGPDGAVLDRWRDREGFRLVTALAIDAEDILVADAGSRWIHRYGHDRRLRNHIGDRHRKGGFHIPNGVLDFALDRDGSVVVANPGMHRVERYHKSGEPLGHFGRFDQHDPAGFPGCCNPTNLALGPNGEIVVSEKAGPRVKVYDAAGELVTVVAAGEAFDPACHNMDVAVSREGVIGVVDTVARRLALFTPEEAIP